jgi:hypothetical protein
MLNLRVLLIELCHCFSIKTELAMVWDYDSEESWQSTPAERDRLPLFPPTVRWNFHSLRLPVRSIPHQSALSHAH